MSEIIKRDVPLAPYTTFGIGGEAEYFCSARSFADMREAVRFAKEYSLPITVLGGGSNLLIADEGVQGLVIHLCTNGIVYHDEGGYVDVVVEAGHSLDACVHEVTTKGLWGIENLSHIPGTVGATPIQNVGAYGVEVKDIIERVTVYDTEEEEVSVFSNAGCDFGYRDSFFKRASHGRYIVLSVTFRLSKTPQPKLEYMDLHTYFGDVHEPTLSEIRAAIIHIRSKKFPDWRMVGTAGSFFKNPTITEEAYQKLKMQYPELPGYQYATGGVKIPLGWILDHILHLKGYREGVVSLYEHQALVLVNHGGATAHEVLEFSKKITDRIYAHTGIVVEHEVRCIS